MMPVDITLSETRFKANRAISIASATIALMVILGTIFRLRMEGFHIVFPVMWAGSALSIMPLIFANRISYQTKSLALWLSWSLMSVGALIMFGIGSVGLIFFLVATTFAALNLTFNRVVMFIFFKTLVLMSIVLILTSRGSLPVPPQGISFFQQPHIWIVHILIASIAGVAIVYVTTMWNSLNQKLAKKTEESFYNGIGLLSLTHDTEMGSHLTRVSAYAAILLTEYIKRKPETATTFSAEDLSVSAQLHDIGKISIPATILQKPGKLTDEEFTLIKTHTVLGADLISQLIEKSDGLSIRKLELAREISLSHHENWDGTGYPSGLKGQDIPLSGRIVAICDVYDALRSQRPYKRPYTHQDALKIMSDEKHKFDPDIFAIFKDNASKFEQTFARTI